MNLQNSWKRTQDIEIDLADLLRGLCVRWKQAVICAAAAALLLGGYGYFKNSRNTDAGGIHAAEDIAADIVLDEEEQQKVTDAAALKEEALALKEYVDESVLMQIDPYHKNRAAILYCIEGAEYRNLQKILGSYVNFAANGGLADAVIKADKKRWDMDKSYLTELITAYQKTYTMPYETAVSDAADSSLLSDVLFCVEVTAEDEKMTKELARAVQSELEKYSLTAKKQAGRHKLTLLSCETSVTADGSLQAYQHDRRSALTSSLSNLQAMTGAFSEKQMIVYNDTAGIEEGKEKTDENPSGSIFSISRKYIVLGLFGGIFLYICLYAGLYLVSDTIKSTGEMRRMYLFPVYGALSQEENKMLQTLNRIRLSCRKKGITKLCVTADFPCTAKEKECIDGMTQQLREWGIGAFAAERVCSDAAVWDTLTETGYVLLVCRAGVTTHRQIDEEMQFYTENGIQPAGAALMDF